MSSIRTTNTEPTVEAALKELRKIEAAAYWRIVVTGYTTPGGTVKQDVDIVFTALVTLEQRIFRAEALSDAMAQVRAWHEQ